MVGLVLSLLSVGGPNAGAAQPALSAKGPNVPVEEPAAALPHILSTGDALLYRRILQVQSEGDWATADRLLPAIRDRILHGDVLARRYLDSRYKASFAELRDWLYVNRTHLDAPRLYRLAVLRKPSGAALPPKPVAATAPYQGSGDLDQSWRDKPLALTSRSAAALAWYRRAEADLAKGQLVAVRKQVETAPDAVDPALVDAIRGGLALRAYLAGDFAAAQRYGQLSARSAGEAPTGAWFGGLAAWRQGKYEAAATLFEAVASSAAASEWTASGGAFWAARAHGRLKRADQRAKWLEAAATSKYSFYGLLAARTLGRASDYRWELPTIAARDLATLLEFPGVGRALALVQVEDRAAAERELRAILPRLPDALLPAMVTLAEQGGMPGLAMHVAGRLQEQGGPRLDAALYPVPPWKGMQQTTNPALLYAFARQESQFDPSAQNGKSGAAGLMQLMPATARAMAARGPKLASHDAALLNPDINITLADRLVNALLRHDDVDGNMLYLLAAYNAGEGALQRWKKQMGRLSDPLLFLESIPAAETRQFVERTMANFWIYQDRLNQTQETLEAMAGGGRPLYSDSWQPTTIATRR